MVNAALAAGVFGRSERWADGVRRLPHPGRQACRDGLVQRVRTRARALRRAALSAPTGGGASLPSVERESAADPMPPVDAGAGRARLLLAQNGNDPLVGEPRSLRGPVLPTAGLSPQAAERTEIRSEVLPEGARPATPAPSGASGCSVSPSRGDGSSGRPPIPEASMIPCSFRTGPPWTVSARGCPSACALRAGLPASRTCT